ncbi:MAG: tRNA (adenosine(37)-N6)-dimethylallyltransferase MiaA [Clostridiales bacterium]|nr:tRNA (adenosine(37)-N6)-dimethylallyltransferase MiaA [Clostridiales bacterium]
MKPKILCVAGPTASGKSTLGMALAEKLHGEIVCMDSMQVYRRMDIGTSKPTPDERAKIPHHLVDIREPGEPYTVAQYAEDVRRVIDEITGRCKLPILVGGTGFYLRALTHGLHLGGVPSDPKLRRQLKAEARDADGRKRLYGKLKAVDLETAERLHENDIVRVSRALEVYELTGIPLSKQNQPKFDNPYDFCILGTAMERAALYRRINARVGKMMEDGLLNEVKALLDEGVSPQAQAMQGIGYKELIPVLLTGYLLDDAVLDVKRNTRHYAKRQLTWFKRDESIHWLDTANENTQANALKLARSFLEGIEA